MLECTYCKSVFSNQTNLNIHIETAVFCLKIRGIEPEKLNCKSCNQILSSTRTLKNHQKICKLIEPSEKEKQYIEQIEDLKKQIEEQKIYYEKRVKKIIKKCKDKLLEKDEKIKELQKSIETIVINAVQKHPEKELIEKEIYKSGKLTLNNIVIEAREDGMINATCMCKAGGKLYADWFRKKETKNLIEALKKDIGTSQIIEVKRGGNHTGSWIHPDLAVQLAQWISPTFAIQFRDWIKEVKEENINLELENKIKELQTKLEEKEKYKQGTLVMNGITIESREDGLINATQMCKAGGKEFAKWYKTENTKALIEVLKVNIPNGMFKIIEVTKGRYNSGSWIHPDLAVQLAQWLSPSFAIQVSRWVRELALTGSVSLTTQKTNEELLKLQQELLTRNNRIKHLENLTLQKQRRVDYPGKYVIYIITTESKKKSGIYKIGFAKDLKKRLSTYNSSEEHEVIFYQSCESEDDMKTVERIVFSKLKKYRVQANREIFKLKEEETVDIFINAIKECIEFIKMQI